MSLRIQVTNGIQSIKEGDTLTEIKMLLIEGNGTIYDLSGKTAIFVLSSKAGKLLEKPVVETDKQGEVVFSFAEGEVTGAGQMFLEVHVTDGPNTKIFPSSDYLVVSVDRNLNIIGQTITSIQFEQLTQDVASDIGFEVENVKEQINNLVVDGDSSPEAAQARVGFDGTNYTTLKERIDTEILSKGSASPKGVYATLTDLQTSKPSGDENIYLVSSNGNWYFWNGSAWTSGGTYQSTGLGDNTVTSSKLALEAVSTSKIEKQTRQNLEFTLNRVNETMTKGLSNQFSVVSNIVTANATVTLTTPANAVPNDEGKNIEVAFTNAGTSHISVQNIPLSSEPPTLGFWMKKSELIAAESVLELYPSVWFQNAGGTTLLNISLDGLSGAPVLKANALITVGTKFSYAKSGVNLYFESISEMGDYIYWVAYTDIVFPTSTKCRFFITLARKTQAITLNFFDPFWSKTKYKLVPRFKSNSIPYPVNKYINKKWVTLGDSITWQDSVVYSYNGLVARGYQTIVRERLGFTEVLNMGVSGRPMANGTANGVGTNTTGKTVTYTTYDLTTIAAGTNDFKLNVPLGTLGVIGDTTFNTNTFYGAYRDLIEYILTQKPTQKIILLTPLQRDNGSYDVNTTNTAGHKLIDYVNAVKSVGQMYSLPVIDLYAESGLTKLNLSTYTWDGLHPNDAGYERISELIVGELVNK